jgi:hypothetical protein
LCSREVLINLGQEIEKINTPHAVQVEMAEVGKIIFTTMFIIITIIIIRRSSLDGTTRDD